MYLYADSWLNESCWLWSLTSQQYTTESCFRITIILSVYSMQLKTVAKSLAMMLLLCIVTTELTSYQKVWKETENKATSVKWPLLLNWHPTWKALSLLLMTASCAALCFLLHATTVGGVTPHSSVLPARDASFFLEEAAILVLLLLVCSSLAAWWRLAHSQISFSSASGNPGHVLFPGTDVVCGGASAEGRVLAYHM